MKKAGLKYYFLIVLLVIILSSVKGFTQVGGNSAPLQNSTHTYRIDMGDVDDIPSWRIFDGTIDASDIDLGLGTVMIRGVDYKVTNENISGGEAFITIDFSGAMAPGDYTLAYKETNDDNCFRTVAFSFTLHPPFDVDVELVNAADALRCSDLSGTPELPGFTNYRTSITYRVYLASPDPDVNEYDGNWQFRFIATATGQSGASASVYQVTADNGNNGSIENTYTPAVVLSTFSQDYAVSSAYSEVLFTVIYNDVLGVDQNIRFELTAIEGGFREIDLDNNDRVNHVIWAMPNAGDIEAMN